MSHEVRKGYDESFVLIHDDQLDRILGKTKPYTLSVFVALMRRANRKEGMTCYPSIATIATEAGVSRTSVKVALRELEEAGVLRIEQRVSDEGDLTSNLYTILRPSCGDQGMSQDDRGGSQDDRRVGRETTDGVGRVATTNHMKSIEPEEVEPDIPEPGSPEWWFDQFWEPYPRKDGKEAARKAWKKLPKNPDLYEHIINQVDLFKQTTWKGVEKRFIPMGSTFLNGKRWEDEPMAPASPSRGRHEGMSGDEILAYGQELEERLKEMFR